VYLYFKIPSFAYAVTVIPLNFYKNVGKKVARNFKIRTFIASLQLI